jgi:predicted kinase
MSATLHLICGSTGAGKTTYSLKLCRELGAVHFAIDEWMTTLFASGREKPDFPWIAERIERCETLMGAHVLQLAKLGVSSVLDLSLLRIDQRRKWTEFAAAAGLSVKLHFLDADPSERWQRVTQRNEQKGETYRLTVTRFMFDFIESIWQPPSSDEMQTMNGIKIAA